MLWVEIDRVKRHGFAGLIHVLERVARTQYRARGWRSAAQRSYVRRKELAKKDARIAAVAVVQHLQKKK